jgi:hypothetical protein
MKNNIPSICEWSMAASACKLYDIDLFKSNRSGFFLTHEFDLFDSIEMRRCNDGFELQQCHSLTGKSLRMDGHVYAIDIKIDNKGQPVEIFMCMADFV